MRNFHTMAKPAGASCNLDRTFGQYLSKHELAGGPDRGAMDDATLERYVRNDFASVTAGEVTFTWQGGEPTLRGLAYFEKVVVLQRKHAKPAQRIENDLQTNGGLLDEAWAAFEPNKRSTRVPVHLTSRDARSRPSNTPSVGAGQRAVAGQDHQALRMNNPP